MNELPPDDAAPDEIDDLYRRAAALDSSRPSEAARRSILDHAARVAADYAPAERPTLARVTDIRAGRRATKRGWRPALFGTLAAAVLAGLVVVPRLWNPSALAPSPQLASNAQSVPPWGTPTADSPSPVAEPAPNAFAPRREEVEQAPRPASNALSSRSAAALGKKALAATPPSFTAPAAPAAPPAPAALGAANNLMDAARDSEALNNVTVTAAKSAPSAATRLMADSLDARQRVDANSTLRSAAQTGDLLALNHALGQSVDVNARDAAGHTPLMLAILNGQGAAVDALLAHGADPNTPDASGTMPLAAAVQRADPSIVEALRRAGARATP